MTADSDGALALSPCGDTDSLAARPQPAVGVLRLGADVGPGASPFSAWPVLRGILPGV